MSLLDRIHESNHNINQIQTRNKKRDHDDGILNKENERKFNEIKKDVEDLFLGQDQTVN